MNDVRLGNENEETSLLDYRLNDFSDNATKIRVAEAEAAKAKAEAAKAKAEAEAAKAKVEAEKAKVETEKAKAVNKNIELRDKYTGILLDAQSDPEQKRIAQEFLQSLNPSQHSWKEFFNGLGCFIFSFIFIT